MTVNSKSYSVDASFEKIGRALAGGHVASIVRAVYAQESLREQMINRVMMTVNDECSVLCSTKQPVSLFRTLSIEEAESFSWGRYIDELRVKAPTLLRVVTHLVTRSDSRNIYKKGDDHQPGICTAIAILLKERNKNMCGIQTFVSLVLFSTRVNKMVRAEYIVLALIQFSNVFK